MNVMWKYLLLEGTLKAVGLKTMDMYISRHHNTVAQYIAMQPILDLFLEAYQRPVSQVTWKWW